MTTRVRRLLFWCFVTVFIILAPTLVLYTSGYNVQLGRLVGTGILSLATMPKDALIILDGTPTDRTTPSLIKRLRPRQYDLRLVKDGYVPFEGSVNIRPRETAFLEDVVLWLDAEPVLETSSNIVRVPSSNKDAFASLVESKTWTEAWIEPVENGTRTLVARFAGARSNVIEITWSPDGSHILLKNGEREWIVVPAEGGRTLSLRDYFSLPILNAEWDAGRGSSILARTSAGMWRMHADSGALTRLQISQTISVISLGEDMLSVREESVRAVVERTRGANAKEIIAVLPPGSYAFAESRGPLIQLVEAKHRRVILLDAENTDQPILLNVEAERTAWSPDERSFLWSDNINVHLFTLRDKQDRIVARANKPITAMAWHPSSSALVVASADGLFAYDLHSILENKPVSLSKARDVSQLFIDRRGQYLFFLGTTEAGYGLYRQDIRL